MRTLIAFILSGLTIASSFGEEGKEPGVSVTFHGDKLGLRVEPGRALSGEVVVADIGIPSAIALTPVGWLADLGQCIQAVHEQARTGTGRTYRGS